MVWFSCPICARQFDAEQTPSRPFCSQRCRQIDLGRWLSEKYTVPEVRLEDEEVPPAPHASLGRGDSDDES